MCAEMSERPRPAITACLMVSFEPISMVSFGGWIICAFRKNSKILRVPEPSSRTMNFWFDNSVLEMRLARARRWSAAAIIT